MTSGGQAVRRSGGHDGGDHPTARPPDRPTLDELRAAATALENIAVRTPLIEAPELSRRLGVPVWLKCEHWQPVGAFKVRGAWTAVSRLDEVTRKAGIIAHSSGNHGRAVAWVAHRLGIPAVIVMNDNAPAVKVDAVRAEGADRLPMLALEPDRHAEPARQLGGFDQGSAEGDAGEGFGGASQVGQ